MDKRIQEQMNLCSRLLQEEEIAQTLYSKRRARLDYLKEYDKLEKLREKAVV